MDNITEYWNDGVNFHLHSKVKIPNWMKAGLILLNSALCLFLIFLASESIGEFESGRNLIMIVIGFLALWFYTLGRYSLWNLFGEEDIIINSKAIHWTYNYGFFSINRNVSFSKIIWYYYYEEREFEGQKWSKLFFDIQNEETNLRENVFESTVLIKEEIAKEVFTQIQQLFQSDIRVEFGFSEKSDN